MKLNKTGLKMAFGFLGICVIATLYAFVLTYGSKWLLAKYGEIGAGAVILSLLFIPFAIIIYFLAAKEDAKS